MALQLEIQAYRTLTNDDEVCIPCLSSILLAVSLFIELVTSFLTSLRLSEGGRWAQNWKFVTIFSPEISNFNITVHNAFMSQVKMFKKIV